MTNAAPITTFSISTALRVGMIVRFPVDLDAEDESFRDFRIGTIFSVN